MEVRHRFGPPVSPDILAKCEAEAGIVIRGEYREWLLRAGGGHVNGIEVFSIFLETAREVPDATGLTIECREDGMPEQFLIIGESGMGEWYVLDLEWARNEPPVALWSPVFKQVVHDEKYDSFYQYLIKCARLNPDCA